MAQHAAVIYYVILLVLYVTSPSLAYNFSELIEAHAVDTYGALACLPACCRAVVLCCGGGGGGSSTR